ncbi:MAG: Translation initiation factor IF-2 [Chlamydiae bacterium]|nr:Translation initiation factor IF-2 [Chlamydiota bacterium]
MAKKSEKEKKSLKLNIQNKQIAKAINLKGIKEKLSKKKASKTKEPAPKKTKEKVEPVKKVEEAPRIKARSKSAFSEEAQKMASEKDAAAKKAASMEVEGTQEVAREVPKEKLGPTGKHISDLLPQKKPKPKTEEAKKAPEKAKPKFKEAAPSRDEQEEAKKKGGAKKGAKGTKFREFRDIKSRPFDSRDRAGLRAGEEPHYRYRKRKKKLTKQEIEEITVRPSNLTIRLPISVKELASEMKRKASELIAQLFKHGVLVTINDFLDDETTIQILGEDLECKIEIDTSEEERIRITDKTIQEEIAESDPSALKHRAPVVTFMGHVDHGKTSLIDKIRESDIVGGEAGAITQHIGAFLCHTDSGEIAILDTPGHEAFTAMRHRGANVTDIVVLVIAGDEGFRQQTEEALEQARDAGVSIVVALNKCDKPNFDAEKIYRQLSEHELLPEVWGGQTVTINCSAITGEGVKELVEMLALQAEVMELKSNPTHRARGTVLESEMHKGLGSVATVLIQNGTLKQGDSFVVDHYYGRVKMMQDEHGKRIQEAGPSTPVELTGLSGIPEAGTEFVVVANEKEARNIAGMRRQTVRQKSMQKVAPSLENMMAQAQEVKKKEFNLMICTDVQGSLEALENALRKIKSEKVTLNIISKEVGEVSESNIQRAAASQATIIGFHTAIESHAEPLLKQLSVDVKMHDIIYHAIDDVREMMRLTLDKLPVENERGTAEVRQIFKSSQLGLIAGCYVTEGAINRSHHVRVIRDGEVIWTGTISSLRRVQEDAKEVQKGLECGILIKGFDDAQEGDIIEAFEISYIEQDL